MVGVAGRVTHVLEDKVAGGIVMDEDSCNVPVDIAASGVDAPDGQERGAQQVEPTGTTFDADSGFVEMSDRATVLIRSTMSSKRCAVRRLMAAIVAVEIGTANRLLIRSASLVSGLTWTCSRSLTHAVMHGPYWTGTATPVGKTAPVTAPQVQQRQRSTQCSVVSIGCGSDRSKTCRQIGAP